MDANLLHLEPSASQSSLEPSIGAARPNGKDSARPERKECAPETPDVIKPVVGSLRQSLRAIVHIEQDGVELGWAGLNGAIDVLEP
jgi:hypothetical protein